MSKFIVTQGNTFEEWRVNTNQISSSVGDTKVMTLHAVRKYSGVSAIYDRGGFYPSSEPDLLGTGATFDITIYANPNFDPDCVASSTNTCSDPIGEVSESIPSATIIQAGNTISRTQRFFYTCEIASSGDNSPSSYISGQILIIKGSNLGGINNVNDLRIHITNSSLGKITETNIYGVIPNESTSLNQFITLSDSVVPDIVSEVNQLRIDILGGGSGSSSIHLDTTAQTLGGGINELFQIQRGSVPNYLLFDDTEYPLNIATVANGYQKSRFVCLEDAIKKIDTYQGNGNLLSLNHVNTATLPDDKNITTLLMEHRTNIGFGEAEFLQTIPDTPNNAGTSGNNTDHPMGYVNLSDNITDALNSIKSKVDFSLNEHGAPLSKIQAGTWQNSSLSSAAQGYDHGYANFYERIGASARWNEGGASYQSNVGVLLTRVPTENDFLTGLVTQEVYETSKLRYFRDPSWTGIDIINANSTTRQDPVTGDGSPETGINTLITILNTLYESSKGETLDNVYLRRDGMFDMFSQKSADAIARPLTLSTAGISSNDNMLFFREPTATEIVADPDAPLVEQMRISTNGSVGIGKTADASAKLDVYGHIKGTKFIYGTEDTDLRYLKLANIDQQIVTSDVALQGISKFTKELQIGEDTVFDSTGNYTQHNELKPTTFKLWTQDVIKSMLVQSPATHDKHEGVDVEYESMQITGSTRIPTEKDYLNNAKSNGNIITTEQYNAGSPMVVDTYWVNDIHIIAGKPTITLTGKITSDATTIDLDETNIDINTSLNDEVIEDVVGAMVSGNTEKGIAVTYQTDDGTLDFTAWDHTIKLTGDVTGEVTMNNSSDEATYSIDTTGKTIALGTDTSGAYVKSVVMHSTNNNGVSVSGSAGGDYTIQSDATSINTANTIVYRDASGAFSCGVMTGTATKARYADLAENYVADKQYEVGTVLSLGGEFEVTESDRIMDSRIVGVVSENPAYLMNSGCSGEFIATVALRGRVPVKVEGPVDKGDIIISSGRGTGVSNNNPSFGSIIGKAVVSKTSEGTELIEVVIT